MVREHIAQTMSDGGVEFVVLQEKPWQQTSVGCFSMTPGSLWKPMTRSPERSATLQSLSMPRAVVLKAREVHITLRSTSNCTESTASRILSSDRSGWAAWGERPQARDTLSADVASLRHPPATVVGAYSISTSRVIAGASRGGGRGCAENVCSEALGHPADI